MILEIFSQNGGIFYFKNGNFWQPWSIIVKSCDVRSCIFNAPVQSSMTKRDEAGGG